MDVGIGALLVALLLGAQPMQDGTARGAAPGEVRIVMVGDVLMHVPILGSGRREDGSYSYRHLFAQVGEEIREADLAVVNQETILGGEELGGYTGYPSFNSPYEVGDAEAEAGFDVILHGTNHALDRSARGIENCLGFWRQNHPELSVLGIHDSAEDRERIVCREVGGMRIAFLNYTYGTNGIQMPKGKGYLVDILTEDRVWSDIARAEAMADFTVVCPHWGTEYRLAADSSQERWTRIFWESGADLVLGTHPHVIEPIEIRDDGEGRWMPVYYSLGNFVNATSGTGSEVMNRAVGGMARVTLRRGADGAVRAERAEVLPLVCHLGKEQPTVYFLSDYTEALARENRFRELDPAFSLEACEQLVDRVWPDTSLACGAGSLN